MTYLGREIAQSTLPYTWASGFSLTSNRFQLFLTPVSYNHSSILILSISAMKETECYRNGCTPTQLSRRFSQWFLLFQVRRQYTLVFNIRPIYHTRDVMELRTIQLTVGEITISDKVLK
jgi:hypothetical protein